jgi:hypothetical protein
LPAMIGRPLVLENQLEPAHRLVPSNLHPAA